MLDRITFNRLLLLPTFALFHALGLAPFHQRYSPAKRHSTNSTAAAARAASRIYILLIRSHAGGIAVILVAIVVFVVWQKIDLINTNVNELVDQWLMLSTLSTHLVTQAEALLTADRQRRCCRRMYAALRFAAAPPMGVRIDVRRLATHQRRCTWTPFALATVGMFTVYVVNHDWDYMDWMVVSRLIMHVRFLQLAVFVEWLGVLQAAQIRALRRGRASDCGERQRCALLEACMELYARTAEMADDVGACFGWSLVATLVQCLNALVNTAYWAVYNVSSLRDAHITLCECGG